MHADIEIAQSCTLQPISRVAEKLGLGEENLEHYGKYMAKLRLPPEKPGEKRGKLILVTAINPTSAGEGKTTIAANLAVSLARKGKKVILVDCDLRNPSVVEAMGMKKPKVGIVDILKDRAKIKDALIPYGDTKLMVLPGAQSVSNPGKLIGSREMENLLNTLARIADYVIVDTPPCGMLSDASIVARFVQGIVMVIRQDYTRTDRILAGVESIVPKSNCVFI